jgi:predicted nucleic acid-binding protein
VTIATLEQTLREHDRMLLDTTSLIAYLDQGEQVSPLVTHIVDEMVFSGRNPAVVSMVSISEVLIRPLRTGARERYHHTMELLTGFPNLRALPVDLPIAQEAASLRAAFRLSMADSLIVGTGIVSQVHHLATNDVDWQRRLQPISGRIRVCLLSQHL